MQKTSAATGVLALAGYVAWAAYAPHIESAKAYLKNGVLVIQARERSVGSEADGKLTARAVASVTYAGPKTSLPVTIQEQVVAQAFGLERGGYVEYRLSLKPSRNALPGRRVTRIKFENVRLEDQKLGLSRPVRGQFECVIR